MANYITTTEELTGIANKIRTKTGGSEPLEFPSDFVNGINGLVTANDLGVEKITNTVEFSADANTTVQANKTISTIFHADLPSDMQTKYVKTNTTSPPIVSKTGLNGWNNYEIHPAVPTYDNGRLKMIVSFSNMGSTTKYVNSGTSKISINVNYYKNV